MSKIVITADELCNRAKFVSHVRRITGVAMSEILRCIDSQLPLVEYVLFLNDHDEVARRLRDLLTIQEQEEGVLGIYELMPDEVFSECSLDQCRISASTLHNILDSHEEQRMRRNAQD